MSRHRRRVGLGLAVAMAIVGVDVHAAGDEMSDLRAEMDRAVERASRRDGAEAATSDQQSWLKALSQACRSDECVQRAYIHRIGQLVDIDDDIHCEDQAAFPHAFFEAEPDLGSGYGSPTRIDLDCRGSLLELPFLARLNAMTERTRREVPGGACSGSLVYALIRHDEWLLQRAGLAPRVFLRHERHPFDDPLRDRTARSGRAKRDALRTEYFQQWAEQSHGNRAVQLAFLDEVERARPRLADWYRKTFGLSRIDAGEAADDAMRLFEERGFGAFPGRAVEALDPLLVKVRDPRATASSVRGVAAEASDPQVYRALKVSLILHRDPAIVRLLVEHLGTIDDDSLARTRADGEPIEPPLFDSLDRPDLADFLLLHGAEVDQENAFGKTALYYAAAENRYTAAGLLLSAGADVNHRYKRTAELGMCSSIRHGQRTPLMHAGQHSDPGMIALLVAAGARTTDLDETGASALDYAVEAGRADNVALLRKLMPQR